MKNTNILTTIQRLQINQATLQSIHLLELNTLDLEQAIQLALNDNPLLTLDEPETDTEELTDEVDLAAEQPWEDFAETTATLPGPTTFPELEDPDAHSVKQLLLWQLNDIHFTAEELPIAYAIIDALSSQGFLDCSLSELQQLFTEPSHTLEQIEAVRQKILRFDPYGVAALSLQEYLTLQLALLPATTPGKTIAHELIQHDLAEVAKHQYHHILQRHGWSEIQLQQALTLIAKLQPTPFTELNEFPIEVQPKADIIIRKLHGQWQAELNFPLLSHLKIDEDYYHRLCTCCTSQESAYLHQQHQLARLFMQNLGKRQATLLQIAHLFIAQQLQFLEHGKPALQPLTLSTIAQATGLHVSTISRAVKNKYIQTPHGLYALKTLLAQKPSANEHTYHFFIDKLKQFIAQESSSAPLTDSELANLFTKECHTPIARRTIAKYRNLAKILPAPLRKTKF
jgi:RNA polymerase sigma-54 factor